MSDFFRFEDEDIDFPFYNEKPKLSISDWLILLLGVLIFIGIVILPISIPRKIAPLIFGLSTILPILYVSRGNWNLFFRMPNLNDILLIILCALLYYLYSIIMIYIFNSTGVGTNGNVVTTNIDIILCLGLLIQLLGEELFKIILMLSVMFLVYNFTNKRKVSIICGVLISTLMFGLIHYNAYNGALAQIIIIIGFGSLFYTYAYLKTKNVIVAYISHILIDGIIICKLILSSIL